MLGMKTGWVLMGVVLTGLLSNADLCNNSAQQLWIGIAVLGSSRLRMNQGDALEIVFVLDRGIYSATMALITRLWRGKYQLTLLCPT